VQLDPTVTDPEAYRTIFENVRVRVLAYSDKPGHRTTPHAHPDTLRRESAGVPTEIGAHLHEPAVRVASVRPGSAQSR
jgi:hypothetical protein